MRADGLCILVILLFSLKPGSFQSLRAPQRIRVPLRTTNRVTLKWEQPPGVQYTSFHVLVRPPSATVEEPADASAQRRSIRNLIPGERYIVSVIGVTSDGRHSPTNSYELWSEPLPPANLTLKALSQIKIVYEINNFYRTYTVDTVGVEVNWDSSDSTSSLSGYHVQINPRGGTETFPRPLLGVQPDLTNRIFIGLIPGEEYTFTVRAQTGPPYSLVYSQPLSKTIRIPPARPFSVEVLNVGATNATIQTLGPLKGIHDQLYLVLSPLHGVASPPRPDPNRETHDIYTLSGLIPGTRYVLNVYSMSVGVRSEKSFEIVFYTSPISPSPVIVKDFTSTTITLTWMQPAAMIDKNNVVYVIDIQDVDDPEAEVRTVRVPPSPDDSTVMAVVGDLIPGAIYRFSVSTEINQIKSDTATVVEHATVPPQPALSMVQGTTDGVVFRIFPPETGRCPSLKVFYSPPLQSQETVEPSYHKVNTRCDRNLDCLSEPPSRGNHLFQPPQYKYKHIYQDILIPGLPHDERYTIYVRCVTGVIEGPALLISSRASFDPQSGSLSDEQNLPRRRLPCLRINQNPFPRPSEQRVPPDACCGVRPFRQRTQTCCSAVVHKSVEGGLCCGTRYYRTSEKVCCGGSRVADNQDSCS